MACSENTGIDGHTSNRGERTRAVLRAAAASRFARQGFHQTKISDIVADSGLTQPTFYFYFKSKEAAHQELVAEFRAGLQAITQQVVIVPVIAKPLLEQVADSFRLYLDFLAQDRDLTEIGFRQLPTATDTKLQLLEWLEGNMILERENGLVRSDMPSSIIVRCFVGMLDQVSLLQTSPKERHAQAHHCARFMCQGVWLVDK